MAFHPVSLIPPVVAATVEGSYGHHRTAWFEGVLEQIGESLAPALPPAFTPLLLTATVSGGREAIVANCVAPGVDVWVAPEDGAFAPLVDCFRSISGAERLIALMEHVDAAGSLLPLARTVRSLRDRKGDAIVIVDASVSFGADVFSFGEFGVDGVILVPEGALMGIPGLSIVAAGPRLLDHVRACRPNLPVQPYYFDLLEYEKNWRKRTTPYSPDISACVALAKALELIGLNGGLEAHVRRHSARADACRSLLRDLEVRISQDSLTSAFTVCELPKGITASRVVGLAEQQGVHVAVVGEAGSERLRIDHTGYLPDGVLEAWCAAVRKQCLASGVGAAFRQPVGPAVAQAPRARILDPVFDIQPAPGIPAAPSLSIFEIPADEFVAQAATHARRSGGGLEFESQIRRAAKATFRQHHRHDPAVLANRTVGFIGAGNIVREAVDRCQQAGVRQILVYSPSLARQKRAGLPADDMSYVGAPLSHVGAAIRRPIADHKRLDYWLTRGVEVAESADEVFLQAHSIVLLPWFYDRAALAVFDKPPEYINERLIDRSVLSRIEREGRADLLVNAAARAKLVDRDALFDAVSVGWLRYYSDELPGADDPLLTFRNVRFTGHVGGSCRRPQALVGRNTHHILRRLVAHLVEGAELETSDDSDYSLNVLNGTLVPACGWRFAAPGGDRPRRVRVLITDPFDLEALDFQSLRAQGWDIEVLDVSSETPEPDFLAHHLREFRPHILMIRSRTRVDATAASVACETSELAAIVRPGVGIDNLYGGAQQLTAAGIRIINEPFGNSAAVAEMTMHFLMSAAENTLLAPGPTRVERDVFTVMRHYFHPGSRSVGAVVSDVARRFAAWMGASDPAIVVSGSGTALMEAGIENLSEAGDQGLVISHGKFGDRFADIARAKGRTVDVLAVPEPEWGRAISPPEIEAYLKVCDSRLATTGGKRLISFLCLQQNETSSGVAYRADHLQAIVRAARSHNPDIAIIVDAISGAFAHPIDFDALDIDVLVVGSQKGLGVSSGLAFGQISGRAWNRMLRFAGYEGALEQWLDEPDVSRWLRAFAERQRVSYLSLPRLVREQHQRTFSDPPSVFHLLSTQRSLDLHEQDGGRDAVISRHAKLAAIVREGLTGIGLRLMADPAYSSDSVTPALLPAGLTASSVRKQLEALHGFSIAGAQGDYWKGQMVRIGHLGFAYETDVARCLRGLRKVLADAARATAEISVASNATSHEAGTEVEDAGRIPFPRVHAAQRSELKL